jgi:hypothetical protein
VAWAAILGAALAMSRFAFMPETLLISHPYVRNPFGVAGSSAVGSLPTDCRQTTLSLNTKTVGNYVSNIFTELQVADRAQAIIRAREAGMG